MVDGLEPLHQEPDACEEIASDSKYLVVQLTPCVLGVSLYLGILMKIHSYLQGRWWCGIVHVCLTILSLGVYIVADSLIDALSSGKPKDKPQKKVE